jgi:hypothetical protein
MLKVVAAICLLFSMALVVCPQHRSRSWLKGEWEGTGYQIDTEETWTMRLSVQGGKLLIEYPSLNCRGEWKLISINSVRARLREKIKVGRDECVGQGNVLIERLNGRQIAFRYSYLGTNEVSASAILNRKR